MDKSKFKRLGDFTSCAHPMGSQYITRLQYHGEVQILTCSGSVYTTHLGDQGVIEGKFLHFEDRSGEVHTINLDEVETLNTHLGYKEV